MASDSEKTPQQELEELLRLAGGGSSPAVKEAKPNPIVAKLAMPNLKLPINTTWVAVIAIGMVLLAGTIYLVAKSFFGGTGRIVIESTEAGVDVEAGGRSYGDVDSGFAFDLKAGDYVVTIKKEGFLEVRSKVDVVVGEESLVVAEMLPIPESKQALAAGMEYVRLNDDGQEVSFINPQENRFQLLRLRDNLLVDLFGGNVPPIHDVVWSPVGQAAMVQLRGVTQLAGMVDNREVAGRYVILGESPAQAPALPNGITTWLFDEARKTASGWQPVLLTENVRQVAFSADGSEIVYIYEGADGEYSLVRALPDGQEWERVVVDLPRLNNPKLYWAEDPRYLIVDDGAQVLVVDMLTQVLEQAMGDRVPEVGYALSAVNSKVAYVGDDAGRKVIKVYDLLERTTTVVPDFAAEEARKMVWLDGGSLLVMNGDQTFYRVEYENGASYVVPFVGVSFGEGIADVQYSGRGRVLLIKSEAGVFTMRL